MIHSKGTFIGGVLLIAGSCIGAGMLAIPVMTGMAGFIPSIFMFLLAWAFMTLTGLLLVEVNSTFSERINIVSMAERSLGVPGRILSWIVYLFLFYSLLIAYISGSGGLVSTYLKTASSLSIPRWAGSLFFTVIFGFLAYQGTRTVDTWNRFFMAGKIFAYLAMVIVGFRYIQPHLLLHTEPVYAPLALPVLVIAFGYHNMIPTLMSYMQQDAKQVRKVILAGSFFALVVYLIWNLVVLGIVPIEGEWGIAESVKQGRQASDAVAGILGFSWVTTWAEGLAFFALLSSFLAQTLALVHFLADALKVKKEKHETPALCALALIPPLIFGISYPDIFLHALNFAGGICAVLLFGILPVMMAWKGRYKAGLQGSYQLFGGKAVLVSIFIFAVLIACFQMKRSLGW